MTTTITTNDTVTVDGVKYIKAPRPSTELSITLGPKDVAAIAATVGGRNLKTPEDIVKLFVDNFRIKVNNVEFDLDPEDAQALKDQYTGMDTFMSYEDYLRDSIREALSLYLWGSTRGILAYR